MLKFKKNLVISTVGDNSLHKHWCAPNAKYDTVLIYYGNKKGYEHESTFYFRKKGFKYHLISDILEEMKDELVRYNYIWVPDDDVYLAQNDVNKLFNIMDQYQLELAQPSILGWYGVSLNLPQPGSLLRYTNWVEIMCPCFSREAILKCQDTFKENNCGWAIEGIWNVRLGHPVDKIAIIDDVIAVHTRAVFSGDTYKSNDPLSEAMSQARAVFQKHNLKQETDKDFNSGKPIKSDVYGAVLYGQIFKDKNPAEATDRFYPPFDFLKAKMSLDHFKND